MSKQIKAIIFDMDGVLIDAKEWHYEALNKALEDTGYLPIPRNLHLESLDGLSTSQKLELYTPTKQLTSSEKKAINIKKQAYTMQMIEHHCQPIELHQQTFAQLKADGYKMAVCSNSIKPSVTAMLSSANLLSYFDFYLSNQDVDRAKPHPDMYVKAISKLNLKPDEVLICEDNVRGIMAALHSGAYVLEISSIDDVNYKNIVHATQKIETTPSLQIIRPPIRLAKLKDMPGGWFAGDFFPNILQTKDFEVAVKQYKAGDKEASHTHKIGTEITVIVTGKVKMLEKILHQGDILCIEPNYCTSFEALEDTTTVVVKTPSIPGDKYREVDEKSHATAAAEFSK